MAKNIRSEYIKGLVEDKERLDNSIKETTRAFLKDAMNEAVSEGIRKLISEGNEDEYEEEEVETETTDTSDGETEETVVDDTTTETGGEDTTGEGGEMEGAEGGDDATDVAGEDAVAEEDDWADLEQFKGEDDEYDLTSLGKEDAIKVLAKMNPEDGIRVAKVDDETIKLNDDNTGKEYIIDLAADDEAAGEPAGEEMDFELELDGEDGLEESTKLGYTTEYQGVTAMTGSGKETANKKDTRSWDRGVPQGDEKPWPGNKGNMDPYIKKEGCDADECDMNEVMTTANDSAISRGTGMTHDNSNADNVEPRNSSRKGEHVKGTGENSYSNATVESIKRKANEIFLENKELKKIMSDFRIKLEEAVVVNASLGNIVKLMTENTTTRDEKVEIVKRFNDVRTLTECKQLYGTISEELKKAGKFNDKATATVDNQLSESKKSTLVETTIYQSDDLSNTLSLMERLEKVK